MWSDRGTRQRTRKKDDGPAEDLLDLLPFIIIIHCHSGSSGGEDVVLVVFILPF